MVARVIHNYALIEKAKDIQAGENGKPLTRITIEDSGELKDDAKMAYEACDSMYIYEEYD